MSDVTPNSQIVRLYRSFGSSEVIPKGPGAFPGGAASRPGSRSGRAGISGRESGAGRTLAVIIGTIASITANSAHLLSRHPSPASKRTEDRHKCLILGFTDVGEPSGCCPALSSNVRASDRMFPFDRSFPRPGSRLIRKIVQVAGSPRRFFTEYGGILACGWSAHHYRSERRHGRSFHFIRHTVGLRG